MIINNVAHQPLNAHNNSLPRTAEEKTQDKVTTLASDNVDKFDGKYVNVNRNYNGGLNRTDETVVRGYKAQSALQMKNAVVADYVKSNMINQAGNGFWQGIISNSSFTPKPFALDAFKKAEATSEKYDDYWGVEATAERIFTFAKTLAGDDEKLFNTMKNAFLKGYSLASKATGDKLPDISSQTKARVLELFDEWEKEINAKNNPEENSEPAKAE